MKLIIQSDKWYGELKLSDDCNFCCEGMKEAYNIEAIIAGDIATKHNKTDYQVCIYHCSPYPEGAVFNYLQIEFCPFCGEKFEVEYQKRIR